MHDEANIMIRKSYFICGRIEPKESQVPKGTLETSE